jgi:hypothetical protein
LLDDRDIISLSLKKSPPFYFPVQPHPVFTMLGRHRSDDCARSAGSTG